MVLIPPTQASKEVHFRSSLTTLPKASPSYTQRSTKDSLLKESPHFQLYFFISLLSKYFKYIFRSSNTSEANTIAAYIQKNKKEEYKLSLSHVSLLYSIKIVCVTILLISISSLDCIFYKHGDNVCFCSPLSPVF